MISVTVCVCAIKVIWLEQSTLNLLDIQCMAVVRHALTLRTNGQGHMVIRCAASVGLHVDRTAVHRFSSCFFLVAVSVCQV